MAMAGTLFVVATPIGNLEDFTVRARRVLGDVDLIAAEDTRRTAKLLSHYEIRKPLVALHEHNEVREAERLAARIAAGLTVALVSDAGTPGISDPGARLVSETRRLGGLVIPIPGASAVTTALSVAGFPASQFVFMGFPPRAGRDRVSWFQAAASEPRLVVFFEAPHRIGRTLADLRESVNRPILCLRELTKIHEQLVECYISASDVPELGEFTVILGPTEVPEKLADEALVLASIEHLTNIGSLSRDEIVERVAKAFSADPLTVKKLWKRARFSSA